MLAIPASWDHINQASARSLGAGRLCRTQRDRYGCLIVCRVPEQRVNSLSLGCRPYVKAGRDIARVILHHHPLSVEDKPSGSLIRQFLGGEAHFLGRSGRARDIKHFVGPAVVGIGVSHIGIGNPGPRRRVRSTSDYGIQVLEIPKLIG